MPRSSSVSDFAFLGILAFTLLAIMGAGIYFLGPLDGTDSASAPSEPSPLPTQAVPGSGAPVDGSTRAGALAVVEEDFRLALARSYAAACALESPAYLAFDVQQFGAGGCAKGSRDAMSALDARGLSMQLDNASVFSFGSGRATVLVRVTVGAQALTERVYLRYHAGRWWITGGDDARGDLGY